MKLEYLGCYQKVSIMFIESRLQENKINLPKAALAHIARAKFNPESS